MLNLFRQCVLIKNINFCWSQDEHFKRCIELWLTWQNHWVFSDCSKINLCTILDKYQLLQKTFGNCWVEKFMIGRCWCTTLLLLTCTENQFKSKKLKYIKKYFFFQKQKIEITSYSGVAFCELGATKLKLKKCSTSAVDTKVSRVFRKPTRRNTPCTIASVSKEWTGCVANIIATMVVDFSKAFQGTAICKLIW